ncbi:DUF488 domain-containing protein [Methylacidiphilum fumariolicum]|uniref:DUF488 domain-containing protein n=2 Tax=Candidatus Methylacidiphilum fumarolicum TaxID=591154 RepID=I0JXK8_METFB|nr:DUF488 domain-containing protein [Candidatus Methylacidiphilum fumarolicum]MBW6415250.1 DUF488 domain-containing protein [Candidatus Methylacidiphilum fumarolicum]CAI9086298.1 conserved protein of unknown function [Candidatus Methylacidiphilum fumarolicum]CCG91977.1 conserved hypothetical protein [Methylacidiphilum fumariolicum SolV]
MIIKSIGHGTKSLEELISMLKEANVEALIDVRSIPRSRHNPQFNKETIAEALSKESILYIHLPEAGGLRHPKKDSPNKGWKNESFRGFADYMATANFAAALDKIIEIGKEKSAALMCAETLPWRCHRSLIADALLLRGVEVVHILPKGKEIKHQLTPWSQIKNGIVTYPASDEM